MSINECDSDRPRLARPVEAVADGDHVFVRIGQPPSYLRLGAQVWSIARLIDGARTLDELANDAGCSDAEARQVLHRLRRKGLLEGSVVPRRHGSDPRRQSLFFLKLTWHEPQVLAALGRIPRPTISITALISTVAMFGAASVTIGTLLGPDMAAQAYASVGLGQLWEIWPAFLLRAIFHEFGHALACLWFGRHVAAVGVGLYYFQPVAFTDVSDIWMLRERWRRVVVHAAGPIVDVIVVIVSGVGVLVISAGSAKAFCGIVFLSTAVGAIATLNPLLRNDGYFLLLELVEEDNLRGRALALLACTAPWRLSIRDRSSAVLVGYGAMSFIYTLLVLFLLAHAASQLIVELAVDGVDTVPPGLVWAVATVLAAASWWLVLRRARDRTLA